VGHSGRRLRDTPLGVECDRKFHNNKSTGENILGGFIILKRTSLSEHVDIFLRDYDCPCIDIDGQRIDFVASPIVYGMHKVIGGMEQEFKRPIAHVIRALLDRACHNPVVNKLEHRFVRVKPEDADLILKVRFFHRCRYADRPRGVCTIESGELGVCLDNAGGDLSRFRFIADRVPRRDNGHVGVVRLDVVYEPHGAIGGGRNADAIEDSALALLTQQFGHGLGGIFARAVVVGLNYSIPVAPGGVVVKENHVDPLRHDGVDGVGQTFGIGTGDSQPGGIFGCDLFDDRYLLADIVRLRPGVIHFCAIYAGGVLEPLETLLPEFQSALEGDEIILIVGIPFLRIRRRRSVAPHVEDKTQCHQRQTHE